MRILLKYILLFEGLRMVYWKKKSIVFANIFLSFQAYLSIKTVVVLPATFSAGTGMNLCSVTMMLWTDTFLLMLFR